MSWFREIVSYLRTGRHKFREELRDREIEADDQWQRSIQSTKVVSDASLELRSSARFIREVLAGHDY